MLVAGLKADLVLTVTRLSDIDAPIATSKCIYDKKGLFLSYGEHFSAKPFTLSTSLDISSSEYILASLSAQVIASAKKGTNHGEAGAVVDMEGYSNPPGEIPYKGSGNIFVVGFVIGTCLNS